MTHSIRTAIALTLALTSCALQPTRPAPTLAPPPSQTAAAPDRPSSEVAASEPAASEPEPAAPAWERPQAPETHGGSGDAAWFALPDVVGEFADQGYGRLHDVGFTNIQMVKASCRPAEPLCGRVPCTIVCASAPGAGEHALLAGPVTVYYDEWTP